MTWPLTVLAMIAIAAATFIFYVVWSTSGKKSPAKSVPEVATNRELETRLKAIETEWEDFYAKARRAMGRAYREKGLDSEAAAPAQQIRPLTRSDLLKQSKR